MRVLITQKTPEEKLEIKRQYKREYMRRKRKDPVFVSKEKEYYLFWYHKNGRERTDGYDKCAKDWKDKHPKEVLASRQVRKALRNGLITKPDKCSRCGRFTKLVGHHPDYNKPPKVEWICQSCHKIIHAKHPLPRIQNLLPQVS